MRCRWFLSCPYEAVVWLPHPVLGETPACARCWKIVVS